MFAVTITMTLAMLVLYITVFQEDIYAPSKHCMKKWLPLGKKRSVEFCKCISYRKNTRDDNGFVQCVFEIK